jgi:hypothetical protein
MNQVTQKIANIVAQSFLTAECKSDDDFSVVVKTATLTQAQELHHLLAVLGQNSKTITQDTSLNDSCDKGCNHFTCGSIGHLKRCPNYPDSLQSMLDEQLERNQKLTKALQDIVNINAKDHEYVKWAKDGLRP